MTQGLTRYLVLEDGTVFQGRAMGFDGEACGDVVFATTMIGYVKMLTNPAAAGQIVIATFPQPGAYGVVTEDFDGDRVWASGLITNQLAVTDSNFRSEGSLQKLLEAGKTVGIWDIDTRLLTQTIRERGVMRGCICQDPKKARFDSAPPTIESVSCTKSYIVGKGDRLAVLDFGVGKGTLAELAGAGFEVTVLPFNTSAKAILKGGYKALVLSSGVENPTELQALCPTVKQLIEARLPLFGIGAGHLLLALGFGARLTTLKHGHHGVNQPIRDSQGKITVTNQWHTLSVDPDLPSPLAPSFVNAFDGSIEGLSYGDAAASSVQFAPEGRTAVALTTFLAKL